MGTPQSQLISRIAKKGCLVDVIEWGITEDDFSVPEMKNLFQAMVRFFQDPATKGSVLGIETLAHSYGGFPTSDDENVTTEALCHLVRQDRVAMAAKEAAGELLLAADVDPIKAMLTLRGKIDELIELGDTRNTDVLFPDAMKRVEEGYVRVLSGQALSGLLYPWGPLNQESSGIQEDDNIIIYGRPKQGKSFLLAHMVADLYEQGHKILLYTKEMTPDNILKRVGAFVAKLPYAELRHGTLSSDDEDRLYDLVEASGIQRNRLICMSGMDAPNGGKGDTVTWLEAKVRKYKPDIVVVDGLYQLASRKSKTNERVEEISREYRQMQLRTRTPGLCTTQANRAAAKNQDANLDEIAHSDALAQDATAAMRVMFDKHNGTMLLKIGGSREWSLEGFRINAKLCTDFSYLGEAGAKEIAQAEKQEAREVDVDERPSSPQSMNGGGSGLTKNQIKSFNKAREARPPYAN